MNKYFVVLYIDLSKMYEATTEKILDEFDDAFFKYQSYEMKYFVNTMETITKEALISIESSNQFQSCQNEESICQDHLRKSYDFVFQPFEINKFPYQRLGFGNYMAFFSYLLVKNHETQIFLGSSTFLQEEEWVRAYQSEVLGNLSSQDVGKMSIMELVQILHHNPKDSEAYSILRALQKEANCDIDEQAFLNGHKFPCMKYYFLTQINPLIILLLGILVYDNLTDFTSFWDIFSIYLTL